MHEAADPTCARLPSRAPLAAARAPTAAAAATARRLLRAPQLPPAGEATACRPIIEPWCGCRAALGRARHASAAGAGGWGAARAG